ncbi:hypothetical protein [Acetobacter thailandicus]|uniref:hypothetical protein n=1 Tax=Acetobacter thailandicus TaxID=1502842 RepID=UPI001BA58CC9|nr:hypothetical protein [Acetobacter thailandicus]MBS0981500.1 hypothetical protein [Acetobacter thailandicus]
MPTVSQFFQPPLYWQQFEDLAHGLLGEVYNCPDAQQFGRPGQAQDGIDVFGRSKRYGMIGVQCKRHSNLDENGSPFPGGPITRKLLYQEAAKSLGFKAKLSIWILATTARRDTAVQNWVNELNEEWEADNRNCRAMVWSWDDIVGYLNAFPELQRWYYEDVIEVRNAKDLDEFILATIRMAFSRPAFEVPLHCETQDEFLQALSDTQRAVRTGELLDRESRQVIRKAVGGWHDIDDRKVRDGLRLVDQLLRHLRTQMVTGQKDGRIRHVNGFLDFTDMRFARELEDHREKCVEILNEVLASVGMDSVG